MVTNFFQSAFAFVIVLGVLVFFHEFGHFLIAKLMGVGVEKFSLGFGPRLIGKTVGITDYRISAIPLGGYVKMVGEEPNAEIDPKDIPFSFTHKSVLKRILIVAAGPVFNLVLAVFLFYGIFQVSGAIITKSCVGTVQEDSPAEAGGLKTGDLIVDINGTAVGSWNEMASIISKSKGKRLTISVEREESVTILKIAPRLSKIKNLFGEDIDRYLIGITPLGDYFTKALNPVEAFGESLKNTWEVSKLTFLTIEKMIQGAISTKTLGGPIMIAKIAGQQAREGATQLIFFIAVLSVHLGILNLLPIPVLDGGHLVFFTVEAVMGKPVNNRVREIAQQAGLFVLLLLMVFVFYNDIWNIWFS